MTRRDRMMIGRPYQASVRARLADLDVMLPGRISAQAEQSATAMREFDTLQGREIAPVAAILLRRESASSSQIEHLSRRHARSPNPS